MQITTLRGAHPCSLSLALLGVQAKLVFFPKGLARMFRLSLILNGEMSVRLIFLVYKRPFMPLSVYQQVSREVLI